MSAASASSPFTVRPFVASSKAATASSIECPEKIGMSGSTVVRNVGSTAASTKSTVRSSTTRTSVGNSVGQDRARRDPVAVGHVLGRERRAVVEGRLDEAAADDLAVGPRHEAGPVGQVGDGVVPAVVAVEAAVHEAPEGEGRDALQLVERVAPVPAFSEPPVSSEVDPDPQGVGVGGRGGRGRGRGGGRRTGVAAAGAGAVPAGPPDAGGDGAGVAAVPQPATSTTTKRRAGPRARTVARITAPPSRPRGARAAMTS